MATDTFVAVTPPSIENGPNVATLLYLALQTAQPVNRPTTEPQTTMINVFNKIQYLSYPTKQQN